MVCKANHHDIASIYVKKKLFIPVGLNQKQNDWE